MTLYLIAGTLRMISCDGSGQHIRKCTEKMEHGQLW